MKALFTWLFFRQTLLPGNCAGSEIEAQGFLMSLCGEMMFIWFKCFSPGLSSSVF